MFGIYTGKVAQVLPGWSVQFWNETCRVYCVDPGWDM